MDEKCQGRRVLAIDDDEKILKIYDELLGGLAVMLGLQTRAAAFLCSGEMAVAYFQFHWKFHMGPEFFPAVNKGELAVLYCFVFLFIACRGGVKWSLDNKG